MKNPYRLFSYGTIAILLTAIIHIIGHFIPVSIKTTEQENFMKQFESLKFEMDPFFDRSASEIMNAYSLYLAVCLLILFFICRGILRSSPPPLLIKNISLIIGVGMLLLTTLSVIYAFSPPIILFGIIAVLMLFSYNKTEV